MSMSGPTVETVEMSSGSTVLPREFLTRAGLRARVWLAACALIATVPLAVLLLGTLEGGIPVLVSIPFALVVVATLAVVRNHNPVKLEIEVAGGAPHLHWRLLGGEDRSGRIVGRFTKAH